MIHCAHLGMRRFANALSGLGSLGGRHHRAGNYLTACAATRAQGLQAFVSQKDSRSIRIIEHVTRFIVYPMCFRSFEYRNVIVEYTKNLVTRESRVRSQRTELQSDDQNMNRAEP